MEYTAWTIEEAANEGIKSRIIIGGEGRSVIATVNDKANAHLIASAPDLYEACVIALGLLVALDTKATKEVAEICRQAIAKAEGK